jgi:hypothetical protein
MKTVKRFLAVAIVGGLSAIGAGAAAALPVDKAPVTTASSLSDVQQARWHHRHWHHRYWHHRHWRHRHWRHRYWRHRHWRY